MTTLTATCATCPYFRQIEGNRGVCTKFDKVARDYHQQTNDCIDEVTEVTAPQPQIPVRTEAPAAEKSATRLEVYKTPSPDKFVVLSHKPSYVFPARYTVVNFGGDSWGCNCPHHVHRKVDCKHIQELRVQEFFGLDNLDREPVRMEQVTFPRGANGVYRAYVGDRFIAQITANYYGVWSHSLPSGGHQWATAEIAAQAAADEWWEMETIIAKQNQEFAIAH